MAQSLGPTEPKWGRPAPLPWSVGLGLVSYHFKLMVELTHSTYKYPTYPFGEIEIKK
jgi:hypothetical protein